MTGVLAGEWQLNNWNPMQYIWNGTYLTVYSGLGMKSGDLQEIVSNVEAGHLKINLDRLFKFNEIVEAHKYMEANKATGKCVVMI